MKSFEITTIEEMEKSSWLNYMLTYIEEMGRGALKKSQKAFTLVGESDIIYSLYPTI